MKITLCLGAALVLQTLGAPQQPGASTDPLETDKSWLAAVSGEIRAGEYHWSAVAGAEQVRSAPNRGQGLRSRVSTEGLEVFPRETGADGAGAIWKLVLWTRSFGREGFAEELEAGTLSSTGPRAELSRAALTEWFENRPGGLEQGWTIASAPPGVEPLWIGLEVRGDLSLRIDAGARSGVFVDACGEARLRYRGLRAWDATGRELEASLRAHAAGAGIAIDDRVAIYPLTVDPLLTDPAWTAEPDQEHAYFGASVAPAGDVNGDGYSDVIVGAPNYDAGSPREGGAWLYHGSASGLATGAAWSAVSDQDFAVFGMSVSTAGDVNGDGYSDVIVGAPQYDAPDDEGRAFVYHGSASGLATSPAWTSESDQDGAQFGGSVGPFLLWGAPGLSAAGDVNGDGYGDVVVAAPHLDNGQLSEGRVHLYHGSSTGLSTSASWTGESDQETALFGWSVSSAGDLNGDGYGDVIVGAYGYSNGQVDEGRAYVYHGSVAGLAPSAAWTGESDQASALFGSSVSTAGDVNGDGYGDVIVGAYDHDNGDTGEGRAYVFHGSGSGLAPGASWTAESDQEFAYFGVSVSAAGDVNGDGYGDALVAALLYDNGQEDEGRAYVFHGSAGGLSADATWTALSGQGGSRFGNSVSSAGDVNADGFGDVIVGAPEYDNGQGDEGRAYLYQGSASGLSTSAAWTAESDQTGAAFGLSVSEAGDVDGDGYDDVIVGAITHDNGQANEGRAHVYRGSASGLGTTAAWTAESNRANAYLGWSVSSAGDVNGDGFGDVLVGVPEYGNGQPREGRAYVFHGSAAGPALVADWIAESNEAGSRFGASVSSAGDVDGDGYSDVLVGAPYFDGPEVSEGRAYLYRGSGTGLAASPAWTVESDRDLGLLGWSVSSAGDVNGDGYADVIVGEQSPPDSRAYVYHGSAGGLPTSPSWTGEEPQFPEASGFGASVSSAGDVNGDGHADVVVGAIGFAGGGRAFVYLGSSGGLASGAAWSAGPEQDFAYFGISVAAAGDVNGDGYGDVIVGAYFLDGGQIDEGGAFVYHGNEQGAPTVRPRQRRVSGGPMALLDRSDATDAFLLGAEFDRDLAGVSWASPGTSTARLQWEVAPLGGSFDGLPDGESAPQALGGTLSFDEVVSGLDPHTPCTWRARIATDNPLFPNTPWFTVQATAVTETKFRTLPTPPPVRRSGPPLGPVGTVP